jgi:hypothetical protein
LVSSASNPERPLEPVWFQFNMAMAQRRVVASSTSHSHGGNGQGMGRVE